MLVVRPFKLNITTYQHHSSLLLLQFLKESCPYYLSHCPNRNIVRSSRYIHLGQSLTKARAPRLKKSVWRITEGIRYHCLVSIIVLSWIFSWANAEAVATIRSVPWVRDDPSMQAFYNYVWWWSPSSSVISKTIDHHKVLISMSSTQRPLSNICFRWVSLKSPVIKL